MVQQWNQYFIERMRETAYTMTPGAMPSAPHYPACLVYLNESAAARHPALMQRLRRVWRGSVQDICCYQAILSGKSCQYRHPDGSEADLFAELAQMSGSQTRFSDRSRLMVYCVLDTTGMTDLRPLVDGINKACHFAQTIRLKNVQLCLILLLDESLGALPIAMQMRAWLRHNFDGMRRYFRSICLLSNCCGNHVMLDSYAVSTTAAAAILLSNTHDPKQQTRLHAISSAPWFTLSYIGLQKPVEEISWVVLKTLTGFLVDINTPQQLETAAVSELLGIEPDGSLAGAKPLIDALMKKLPDGAVLEGFARSQPTDLPIEQLSFADFDRLTMGGFSDYLDQSLQCDQTLVTQTVSAYAGKLYRELTIGQLAGLTESAVHALFLEIDESSAAYQRLSVAEGMREMLRRRCCDTVRQLFYQEAITAVRLAKKQVESYRLLQSSVLSDFGFVHFSPNVEPYYTGIVQRFLDGMRQNKPHLFADLCRVDTDDARKDALVKLLIDEMIASERCFSAAFDEEMKLRIGSADSAMIAGAVKNKLLGHSIAENACWNTPYAITPSYQGIMMNLTSDGGGNMLFEILQSMFHKQNIDYFNTGSSDAVESVALFPLSKEHLYSANEQMQNGGNAQ